MSPAPDPEATAATKARYDRIASLYDWLETIPEARYRPWRQRFWSLVSERIPENGTLLEVGVGTGKNMPYWPAGRRITAIDLSPRMLDRARARAERLRLDARLELGDSQSLRFSDHSFDLAALTFVMCSVPDPVLGLREIARVVRPEGYVLLMEHVRSPNPRIGALMDLANPLVVRLMGPNINRRTVANVEKADLNLRRVEDLGGGGIFKIIEAQVPRSGAGGHQ